jgi:hypothetical protein
MRFVSTALVMMALALMLLEHVPPRLNRGILSGPRMRESIGIDSLWGGGGCRRPILGTCGNE